MTITHALRHREYLEYKRDLLQYWQHAPLVIREIENGGHPAVKLETRQRSLYRLLRKAFYREGRRTVSKRLLSLLDRRSVAIWYQDDGCLAHKTNKGKVHAYELTLNTCLPKEQNLLISDYFKEVWGIEWKLLRHGSHYRLRMGTREGRRWAALIEPECVCDCMRYKIDPLLV